MIQEYISYLQHNKGYSVQTCTEYRKDLEKFVQWLRSSTQIERWGMVTKDVIDSWVSYMSVNDMAPCTIKRRVSALRGLYQYAWVMGLCSDNPAKYVSTPKKGHRLPKVADVDKLSQAIRNTATEAETKLALAIMAETGVRLGELLEMRACDVHQSDRSIVVRGKGNKERKVYYGDMTAEIIGRGVTIGGGKLIMSDARELRYKVHAATGASPHNIRHLWATVMLNNGCPLESISKLMGHASVKTTEIYAEVATATLAADYNKFRPKYDERRKEAACA